MIKNIKMNFYLLGDTKIREICSTTGAGFEADKKLESCESDITSLLLPAIKKQFKPIKKMVYLVEWSDGAYLESGSIKDWGKLECKPTNMTPAELKKLGKTFEKADAKALARPDKEE